MQANGDPPLVATLVLPYRRNKLWLATKMRGIGAGYLNGWGGGVEPGEQIHECAMREFKEETGGAIIPDDAIKAGSNVFRCAGVVHFTNHQEDGRKVHCDVFVYVVSRWLGEIRSTEEMRSPGTHGVYNIRRLNVLPGDKIWFPKFIYGRDMHAWVEQDHNYQLLSEPVIVCNTSDDAR